MNLGKIVANKNLARQSWLFIQDTCKILENIFSRVILMNAHSCSLFSIQKYLNVITVASKALNDVSSEIVTICKLNLSQ